MEQKLRVILCKKREGEGKRAREGRWEGKETKKSDHITPLLEPSIAPMAVSSKALHNS